MPAPTASLGRGGGARTTSLNVMRPSVALSLAVHYLVGGGRPPSAFDADIVFAACARFDKAVEINCRPERQDPPEELLELAVEWGCKVAVDTDAHATGQLEWQAYGADKAVRCNVPVEDIVNTWPAETVLAWAAAHSRNRGGAG